MSDRNPGGMAMIVLLTSMLLGCWLMLFVPLAALSLLPLVATPALLDAAGVLTPGAD